MEGQQGSVPPPESKPADPRPSSYQQTGFHSTNDQSSKDFQQTEFQPTHPLASPTFNLSGFQAVNTGYQPLPAQQETTISAEKFSEIEQAVKAAKAALDKVSSLISDIAFTPQPSGGFD